MIWSENNLYIHLTRYGMIWPSPPGGGVLHEPWSAVSLLLSRCEGIAWRCKTWARSGSIRDLKGFDISTKMWWSCTICDAKNHWLMRTSTHQHIHNLSTGPRFEQGLRERCRLHRRDAAWIFTMTKSSAKCPQSTSVLRCFIKQLLNHG